MMEYIPYALWGLLVLALGLGITIGQRLERRSHDKIMTCHIWIINDLLKKLVPQPDKEREE